MKSYIGLYLSFCHDSVACIVGSDELIKTGAQLVLRRKQLLAELMLIYPVVQVTVITCFCAQYIVFLFNSFTAN